MKTNQVGKFEIGKSRDIPNWATKENSKRKDNAEQISERLVRRLRILFFLRILGRPFIPEKSMFILLTLWKMHDDFSIVSLHYDLSMYFLIFFFIPAWFYLKDKSKRWLWNWDFLSFRNGGLAMLPRGRIRKLFFWTSCMCIVREGQSLVGKEATYLYRLEFLFWVIVLLSYWLLCRDWPIRANLASRMNFHSANDAQFVNMRSADRWFSFLKWFNGHIVYKDRCRLMYPPCYCFPLLSEGLIVTRFIVKFISN